MRSRRFREKQISEENSKTNHVSEDGSVLQGWRRQNGDSCDGIGLEGFISP